MAKCNDVGVVEMLADVVYELHWEVVQRHDC